MSLKNSVVILILIGIITVALSPLWQKPHFIELPLIKKDKPDFTFKKIKMSLLNEEHKEWVINADHAEIDKKTQLSQLKVVTGTVYLKDISSTVQFSSPKATFQMNAHELYLIRPTITIHHFDEPLYINAKTMVWDSSAHILNGHKDVLITNQTMQLRGDYFETNLNEDRVLLSKNARAKIKVLK